MSDFTRCFFTWSFLFLEEALSEDKVGSSLCEETSSRFFSNALLAFLDFKVGVGESIVKFVKKDDSLGELSGVGDLRTLELVIPLPSIKDRECRFGFLTMERIVK